MSTYGIIKATVGKAIEKTPNLLIFLGVVLLGVSYMKFEVGFHFPTDEPKYFLLWTAILLIAIGVGLFSFLSERRSKVLRDNTQLKFNSCTLTIRIQPLQMADNLANDCAFVLPANNTFADDCVTDGRSALGAFFKEHHSDKISSFGHRLKTVLNDQNIRTASPGLYPPATPVLLPEEFSIKAKVILVASSVRNDGKGFFTSPSIISESIHNVFKLTAEGRINRFYFPILGSGHAGLDVTEALNLMILFIKFHTKRFHHVREISIFVLDKDQQKIKANFINSLT